MGTEVPEKSDLDAHAREHQEEILISRSEMFSVFTDIFNRRMKLHESDGWVLETFWYAGKEPLAKATICSTLEHFGKIGAAKRTVDRAIKALEKIGFIKAVPQYARPKTKWLWVKEYDNVKPAKKTKTVAAGYSEKFYQMTGDAKFQAALAMAPIMLPEGARIPEKVKRQQGRAIIAQVEKWAIGLKNETMQTGQKIEWDFKKKVVGTAMQKTD